MAFIFITLSHEHHGSHAVESCFVDEKDRFEAQLLEIQKGFDDGKITPETDFWFTSNEPIQFGDWEEFERGITYKECTEEFYNEFNDLTAYGAVGYCIFDHLLDKARGN